MKRVLLTTIAIVVALAATTFYADELASMSVSVRDAAGEPVTNAAVVLTFFSSANEAAVGALGSTGTDGVYVASQVATGSVLAHVTQPGYYDSYARTELPGPGPWNTNMSIVLEKFQRATLTVQVLGLDRQPVTNAHVAMGFAVSERSDVPGIPAEGVTDSSGRFSATERGIGLVSGSVTKGGYYRTSFQRDFDRTGGTVVVEVVLKARTNPIPMFAKWAELSIPSMNQWYGYDLVAGDWVNPGGKGKTNDMLFKIEGVTNSPSDTDTTMFLAFSTATDGVIAAPGSGGGSEFRMLQEAPDTGYENGRQWHRKHTGTTFVTDCRRDMNYYFRVRSSTNTQGEVVGLYGKVHGEIGDRSFVYYLNPTAVSYTHLTLPTNREV